MNDLTKTLPAQPIEKLLTMGEAANQLGLPCWKIRRAVKAGFLPHYSVLNKRKLVRISEILNVITSKPEENTHGN